MIILSLETSTLLGSVALTKNGTVLSEKSLFRKNSHSDVVNTLIQQVLDEASLQLSDVDVFATGLGPGSFTGIRISFNTAKTFSYVHKKPMAGCHSLKNLAHVNKKNLQMAIELEKNPGLEIACAINAFKNMVYIATYKLNDQNLIETRPAQVIRMQNLKSFFTSPVIFAGDAHLAYHDYLTKNLGSMLIRPKEIFDYPTASSVGQIVSLENKFFTWNELTPLYLRASEAEENINGITFQPL